MTEHTHKQNFGRYVAECPRCVELHPNGPPVRTRRVKAAAPIEEVPASVTSPDDMNSMKLLAELMLRREAKQLAKEEEVERRRLASKEEMRRSVEASKAAFAQSQANCPHQFPNGKSARTEGQIYNHGMYEPFCQICQFRFPKRRPTREEMPTVVEV